MDYYVLLRRHLTENGLVIQWVPNHLPASQYRMVLRTFTSAFPAVTLWYLPPVDKGGPSNTFLVGSEQPVGIDLDRMSRTLEEGGADFDGVRKSGLATGESILAHYIADQDAIRAATGDALENSLEHPYYEFYSPREYAEDINGRVLRTHELLVSLRRSQGPAFVAGQAAGERPGDQEPGRLGPAVQAEDAFLQGLAAQLGGRPHAEVAASYRRALELAPWNDNLRAQIVSYFWNQAGVYYLEGDYRTALVLMAEAVKAYPSHGEVRYYHGLLLLQNNAIEQATEELRQSIALSPRLLAPRRLLASLRIESQAFDEAAEHLGEILTIDPEDVPALVSLGLLLAERRSELDHAADYLERAHRLEPTNPSVIDGRAWLAYLSGDRERARGIVTEGGRYYEGVAPFERHRQVILEPGS
jgi:tetratricopeptide (TPR) repeat protein